MKKAKYIVIEGTEGVGKTTQVSLLIDHLNKIGKRVFQTKEPGTHHNPLTLELRKIMLDSSYDLPKAARELISQSIRSIHIDKVIKPALESNDYIIQDRGLLSALAYGDACGNEINRLKDLSTFAIDDFNGGQLHGVYDKVIVLMANATAGLARAQSAKKEFEAGDAMESKGNDFMEQVSSNFISHAKYIGNVVFINVEGKSREEVLSEILKEVI